MQKSTLPPKRLEKLLCNMHRKIKKGVQKCLLVTKWLPTSHWICPFLLTGDLWACSTNTSVLYKLSHPLWKYLPYTVSQIVRARELKFWEDVHDSPCATFHVSHFICHMSCVTCHVSHVTCRVSYIFFWFCFWTKCWSESEDGLLSTRPTLSSFFWFGFFFSFWISQSI